MGLIDSLYISLTKYECVICDTVHNTAWGQPFGIPIAYLGVLGYGLIYICIKIGKRNYGLMLATAGALASMMLMLVQAFILQQFCIFCMISAGIMISLWFLLWYQERESNIARLMPVVPIVAAGLFILLLPYADTINQSNGKVAIVNGGQVSPGSEPREKGTAQNADKGAAAKAVLEEAIRADMAGEEKAAENSNEGLLKDTPEGEKAGSTETDSDNEVKAIEDIKPEDPEAKTLTTFYRADGSPVEIDINKDYILFFSSHCKVCVLALERVDQMPEAERPMLVDIWIAGSSNLENEKQLVQEKLEPYSINPVVVLYDLDHKNPVPKVPKFINQMGKIPATR